MVYFQKLCKNFDIICIQEYWLYEFQNHELSQCVLEKDIFTRCSDFADPLIGFNLPLPRGKGGVSILWPKSWFSRVKRLNEGKERIIYSDRN